MKHSTTSQLVTQVHLTIQPVQIPEYFESAAIDDIGSLWYQLLYPIGLKNMARSGQRARKRKQRKEEGQQQGQGQAARSEGGRPRQDKPTAGEHGEKEASFPSLTLNLPWVLVIRILGDSAAYCRHRSFLSTLT